MDTYKGHKLEPLNENDPLLPGDRIVIQFDWMINGDWFRALQLSEIDRVLTNRKDWNVVSYVNQPDSLLAEIEIVRPPTEKLQQAGLTVTTTVVVTAAIIASVFIVYHLSKVYQYKLIAEGKLPPETRSALDELGSAAHVATYVGAVIGVLYILKRLFGSGGSSRSSGYSYQ